MKNSNQAGFVLVTSLVLLAILTLMAIASSYKTVTQIKVARSTADKAKASAAADTGLTQIYWYWARDGSPSTGGIQEFDNLAAFLAGTSGTAPNIYLPSETPSSVANAPTDSEIVAYNAAGNVHVITLGAAGVSTDVYTWGFDSFRTPQTAVWVTTFDDIYSAPSYPYTAAVDLNTDTCTGECKMVTYSLARSGSSKTLVRETHSVISRELFGVSAMTNAPGGATFSELCNPPTTPTSAANAGAWSAGNQSTVVEATQAPYLIGSAPSGTALASNTEMGGGGKGFRSDITSKTGATFETAPYIIYSGHDAYSGFKVDYADTTQDTTGASFPPSKIPTRLVNAPLMNIDGEELDFFSNPSAQLFNMDVYRWAAEQFTCQDPTKADGQFGNGLYCSKAEGLRQALVNMGYPAYAPVTGRLNIAQIQYNVANGIPMFGIVRLMFPAVPDSVAVQTCSGVATRLHVIESGGDSPLGTYDFNKLMACDSGQDCAYTGSMTDPYTIGGRYAFSIADGAEPDNDGDLGSNARLMVYGTLLIDYFADYDIVGGTAAPGAKTDTVFNPADGERLLLPLESPDVYLAIEHNMMINPVMPRFMGNNPLAFPTAASGAGLDTADRINMVDINNNADPHRTNKINLASPFDGYFPWAEGMLPRPIGVGPAGTMRLMSRATVADNASNNGLIKMVKGIGTGTEVTGTTAGMTALLGLAKPSGVNASSVALAAGTEADVLHYYYKLMVETLDQKSANDWPVAAWPGNSLANDFCIGKQDCGASFANHMGDKVHLMFPTGYMHAWKVALAALNINANEWNSVLDNIGSNTGLYKQLTDSCSAAGVGGVGTCYMGHPFNTARDIGALNLATVKQFEDSQDTYFNVTRDAATGYGLLDSKWLDIPSTMYSGGLLDMHAHSNMNGIIYTPGPLEWEPGNSSYDTGVHMSYINGSIITGYGAYTRNDNSDYRYVIVFDMQAVDNINTNNASIALRRYDWQRLD